MKTNLTPGFRSFLCSLLVASLMLLSVPISPATPRDEYRLIRSEDLKEWLTYIASDELEGRNTFSEGLALAANYISDELRSWGVRPAGDNGSYFQRVRVLGVKSANRSSVTVEVNGKSRTFKDGAGVTFPGNVGGKRSFTAEEVEFAGYGLNVPQVNHNDYAGRNVKNKVVIWLGARGPKAVDSAQYRRILFARSRYAIQQEGAVATIGPVAQQGPRNAAGPEPAENDPRRGDAPPAPTPAPSSPERPAAANTPGGRSFGRVPLETPDFTTVQRLDTPMPPSVTAGDDFFSFLFSGSDISYDTLKDKAAKQESLLAFSLKNVRLKFDLDADYRVVRTQFTKNVVGFVEGSDPQLKQTFVAFGAHYDHVGYAEGEIQETPQGPRRQGAVGRVTEGHLEDRIWNGADDDGSGTVVTLAMAKAFATGPKPRRSLLFVWHTGEEKGLYGSRYFVDYPTVNLNQIVAQINIDMVGRNRDNQASEGNTVYLVGSDRISTELHNIVVDANASLPQPLTLNYEMNDPTELEQVYYRSDHYSYAAKGIPIVFLTTGLHPDYHANTDSVEKINFEKMTRISQLVYETGRRLANLNHAPARDNRGARAGRNFSGKL
ncbi:MAG TPA: M28 family peptidase [Acidobacteriota bacterium]|jgi:hypothetical protein